MAEEMSEIKQKIEETLGYFVGKELFREGSKNSKAWKMYKLKFKNRMDSEKAFTMTVFNDAMAKGSKKLEELKGGHQYKIIYDEKDAVNNEGIPFISKTAFGFYNVISDVPKGKVSSPQNAPATALKPDLSKFDEFKVKYLAMVKTANMQPNAVHMVGSFIATNEKDRVKELIEKCKEALKNCVWL